MSGIHNAILETVRAELQRALIDEIDADDPTRAGAIKLGPLQGDPDPDVARISLELYENDPDNLLGGGLGSSSAWSDQIEEVEIGGGITWRRRFTVKARCLLETTQEDLAHTRQIASCIRSRIEKTLLTTRFSSITADGEVVTRGVCGEGLHGEMVQSGGPPDAYDYQIKVRFDVLTTQGFEETP